MKTHKIYLVVIAIILLAITIVFNFFPRTRISALEKRELKKIPTFSFESLWSGNFTKEVTAWFSDSEPYRDEIMALSMEVKGKMRLATTENQVTFHASKDGMQQDNSPKGDRNITEYNNEVTADENAKIANAGIIVVGNGPKVRALMAFGGSATGGVSYVEAANKYKEIFGNKVNIYCMVIPTAVEYYCPEQVKKASNSERATIQNMYTHLRPDIYAVDAYTALGRHAKEDIFLRTDHHWAPLGAYYAAEAFCKMAKVPFKSLKSYQRKVVKGYIGSMYAYSKDIAIKNAPEDFVYYEPQGIKYQTTYIDYTINKDYKTTGFGKPRQGPFFYHYKDGSAGAYCTFMGGDTRLTVVRTGNKNKRRLIILKDSFGNALPGFLFYSFEEIHVIDSRYFTDNMKKYVAKNKITDILFANNIFKAYSKHTYEAFLRFLSQPDGTLRGKETKATKQEDNTKNKEKAEKIKAERKSVEKKEMPKQHETQPQKPKQPSANEEKRNKSTQNNSEERLN